MRLWIIVLCLLALSIGYGQSDHEIKIGKYESMQSEILGEEQWIMVHIPDLQGGQKKLPVLYVLDGEWHFYSTVGMIKELGGNLIPPMIVVGILNNNRYRDFSPEGTPRFTQYLTDELLPYIEEHYKVAPYRLLVGHSLAGLFATNTLVNHSNLFNAYLLIDPSLSFGNSQELLKGYLTTLQENKFEHATVQLAVANSLPSEISFSAVQQDTSNATMHMRSILQFAETLKSTGNGIQANWMYYPKEDHASIPLPATYEGLRSIFDYYPFPEEVWTDQADAANILQSHYDNISNRLQYQVLPPEGLVNSLGYYKMSNGNFTQAEQIFQLNVKNYPESFNVYDSIGDLYTTMGDKKKAIRYFEMALEINDNGETRNKLDQLKR